MLEIIHGDAATTVIIPSDLDGHLTQSVKEEFSSIAEEADRDIVLNLQHCEFMDSSGIGAIIFLHKRLLCKGHHLILENIHTQPRDLLMLLKIDKILTLKT